MENLAVTDIGVGSRSESLTRDDECNRTVCSSSPTLGLGALRLTDDAASSLEEQFPNPRTVEGGGLLARRSRRAGRKFPGFLTISNEEEEDNPGTNSSPKTQEMATSPSSSCLENRSHTELLCSSSPSSVLAYGNNTVPVEIVPCLFLGCARDAASRETLSKYDITYILNVTPNLPNVFENDKKYHYKQIAISDHWSQNLSQFFPEAIAFIDEARSENCGILVHCLAGISRSVTVTVAYLMQKNLWSLNDAYDFVKQRKSNVSPNFNFMGQLLDFEKTLAINRDAADSGISSSCSSNSPPTLFFTSPPPPTPSPIPAITEEGAALSCSTGQSQTHQKHRGMFCLSTIM